MLNKRRNKIKKRVPKEDEEKEEEEKTYQNMAVLIFYIRLEDSSPKNNIQVGIVPRMRGKIFERIRKTFDKPIAHTQRN